MQPEIKELYLEFLKHQRTLTDLKMRHKEVYQVHVSCFTVNPTLNIEQDFTITGAHSNILKFLYPEENWL